jgi:hypothetical protein
MVMENIIIIAIDKEYSDIFINFEKEHQDDFTLIKRKSFIESNNFVEYIVNLSPHVITALTAYLVARVHNSKKEIKMKSGDIEIEIKGNKITPEAVVDMLKKLERRPKTK